MVKIVIEGGTRQGIDMTDNINELLTDIRKGLFFAFKNLRGISKDETYEALTALDKLEALQTPEGE